VVVDHHDHFRPDLRPGPGVVSPGLAQTVAADMPAEPQLDRRAADNPPGLNPADGLLVAPVVREEILSLMPREVDREGVKRLPVQRDAARLAGFPLDHDKVIPETAALKVIDILPAEGQKVAHAQGRVSAQHHKAVVPQLSALQEEICQGLEFSLVPDRIGGNRHKKTAPLYVTFGLNHAETRAIWV